MSYPRHSFGSIGRLSSLQAPVGGAGAPFVQLIGPSIGSTAEIAQGSFIDGNAGGTNVGDIAYFATISMLAAVDIDIPAELQRLRSGGDDADNVAVQTNGALLALARNTLFDGTAWDRARAASAAALSGFTSAGAGLVANPGNWSINHTPAAATQATITRAAGGAGVRHVATSISAHLIIQPTINQPVILVNLRDGGTGAGTILWSRSIGVGAALANGGEQSVELSGLMIVGSANTAMTLEFSAAGVAGTIQDVALTGFDAA